MGDGTDRLLEDLRHAPETLDFLDDRGLEIAEAICHAQRHRDTVTFGSAQEGTLRAIDALDGVRRLTKRRA